MPIPTKDEFRAEFHKLKAKQAELEAALVKPQADYDAARELERQFFEENVRPKIDAMQPLKDELHQVNSELGQIVRYLRGANGIAETGDPAEFAA